MHMNNKTFHTLLTIVVGLLAAAGCLLILIWIITKDNSVLYIAIMAIILSNLFNIIRMQRKPEDSNKP